PVRFLLDNGLDGGRLHALHDGRGLLLRDDRRRAQRDVCRLHRGCQSRDDHLRRGVGDRGTQGGGQLLLHRLGRRVLAPPHGEADRSRHGRNAALGIRLIAHLGGTSRVIRSTFGEIVPVSGLTPIASYPWFHRSTTSVPFLNRQCRAVSPTTIRSLSGEAVTCRSTPPASTM